MTRKRRSGEAVAAQHRRAGPMKHRLEPRGGAKNSSRELQEETVKYVLSHIYQTHPPARILATNQSGDSAVFYFTGRTGNTSPEFRMPQEVYEYSNDVWGIEDERVWAFIDGTVIPARDLEET